MRPQIIHGFTGRELMRLLEICKPLCADPLLVDRTETAPSESRRLCRRSRKALAFGEREPELENAGRVNE